jgi:hypothetical protein
MSQQVSVRILPLSFRPGSYDIYRVVIYGSNLEPLWPHSPVFIWLDQPCSAVRRSSISGEKTTANCRRLVSGGVAIPERPFCSKYGRAVLIRKL